MFFKRSTILTLFACLIAYPLLAFQEEGHKDTTKAIVSDSVFNKGNEQDLLGLISGLFPGVIISKAGADPNRSHDAMVRGAGTSFGPTNPLIVIDGIIGAPMNMIDVNNIESVRLLKGYETTQYGMQGANGVLEITTKGFSSGKLKFDFNQSLFTENRIYKDKLLDREGFLALGGNDLGANTNWIDEITNPTVSNISNLVARGSTGKLQYLGSANFRAIDGIMKGTGFDQYSFLAKLKWSPTENLSISYGGSFLSRDADLGYGAAFRQAYRVNPTQPIYFETGQLYQGIFFDYFNPMGFIDFATRETENSIISQNLSIQKKFARSKLAVNANYFSDNSNYFENIDPTFFYALDQYYYIANASETSQFAVNAEFQMAEKSLGSFEVSEVIRAGYLDRNYDYLDRRTTNNVLTEAEDSDELSLYNLELGVTANFKDTWNSQVYLRYENSSALGENKQSTLFPSFSTQVKLGAIFSKLEHFTFNAAVGAAGLTLYDDDFNSPRQASNVMVNPDLSHERSLNSEVGIAYQASGTNLKVGLTRFKRTARDLFIYNPSFGPEVQLENLGEITNTGWELQANYDLSLGKAKIGSSLTLSTLTTEWTAFPFDDFIASFIEINNHRPISIKTGAPYGGLYGYPVNFYDTQFVLIDTDGNGFVNFDDQTIIGQALPQLWLGWRNQVNFGKTTASFMMEGIFGHDIMNSTSYLFGLNYTFGTYNTLEEVYSLNAGNIPVSSPFVESADFLRLRYFSIEHELNWSGKRVAVYAVANNLFTLTGFRGNDPSVRLTDQLNTSYLNIAGVQRTTEWLPSRSFMLGVKLQL